MDQNDQFVSWLRANASPSPVTAQESPWLLGAAEDDQVFWCDPDFSGLVMDASASLDTVDWRVVAPPAPRGQVVFARPVDLGVLAPDLDAPGGERLDSLPVQIIRWKTAGLTMVIETFMRTYGGEWTPVGEAYCPLERSTTPRGVQPSTALAAFSLLLHQPGLAQATTAPRGSSRPAGKGKRRVKPPAVRVVTLRPGTENAAAYDESNRRTVEWRHRWMVRGHWRKQPYPSLGEGVAKPVWIAPYLKGPTDAPMIPGTKVVAVRSDRPTS